MNPYEVIESLRWQRDDGATASIYGACPWQSRAEESRWKVVIVGWTIRNNITNQVGMGRKPFATREEAQSHVDTLSARQKPEPDFRRRHETHST